jgi:hypothetical protein
MESTIFFFWVVFFLTFSDSWVFFLFFSGFFFSDFFPGFFFPHLDDGEDGGHNFIFYFFIFYFLGCSFLDLF